MNPLTAAHDTCESALRRDRERTTPAVPKSAAAARARVSGLLQYVGISPDSVTVVDTLLVTSELVTDAIRHGGGVTAFRAEAMDGSLHPHVGGASPSRPVCRTGSLEQPGGHGWSLVQRLAERTAVTVHTGGKTILGVLPLRKR